MKLVCVTPNPALDRLLVVPGFDAGRVWRADRARMGGGGKGLNVARALTRLGLAPVCAGLLAGRTGHAIVELAEADGLSLSGVWVPGDTRSTTVVIDPDGGNTVINEPGPVVSPADWARFVEHVSERSTGAAAVSVSGSLPPGVPSGGLASLIVQLGTGAHSHVWVDTSGDGLTDALGARPWGIKINAVEAAAAFNRPIRSMHDATSAARLIYTMGVNVAVVTLGADGAVAVSGEGAWVARPPSLAVVNAVGSGDCFLAGLMAAYVKEEGIAEALRLATACGVANALCPDVGDFAPDVPTSLMTRTVIEKIEA